MVHVLIWIRCNHHCANPSCYSGGYLQKGEAIPLTESTAVVTINVDGGRSIIIVQAEWRLSEYWRTEWMASLSICRTDNPFDCWAALNATRPARASYGHRNWCTDAADREVDSQLALGSDSADKLETGQLSDCINGFVLKAHCVGQWFELDVILVVLTGISFYQHKFYNRWPLMVATWSTIILVIICQ